MKVLVLTTTFSRWKDDIMPAFVYELSKQLQESGFEIVVLAPHHYGAKKFEMMDNMKVYRFPYFYPSRYQKLVYNGGILPNIKESNLAKIQVPLMLLSEFYYALKIIKKEKIDIIHSHWIIPSGLVCSVLKLIFRKPLIISVHGSDVALIRRPFLKSIGKQILKNTDICTVNSTATRDSVLDVFRLNKKKIKIIPMGVDLNLFKPLSRRIYRSNPERGPVILTVGRLDKNKGFNYLIDAMPKVIHKFPEAKLIVAGIGHEKDNLTSQIKRLNLEKNTSMVGGVQNKNLPIFYNMADIFVLPSLREGLGVVLLEAMACGTPVIGSNVDGITDIIINNETGILTMPKDSQNIAEKIIMLLSDRELRQKFSEKGLKFVKEKFSWDIVAKQFIEIFSNGLKYE